MTGTDLPLDEHADGQKVSPFTRRVGLTTAMFAVVLSIAALSGGNNTKDIMLAQQKASNQWAYYQAKTIRQHLYASLTNIIELGLVERGATMSPASKQQLQKRIAAMRSEVARFLAEKKAIMKVARAHEKRLDLGQTKDPYFDYSQVFLQIAIILASIAMIAASGRFFIMALAMAGIGSLLLVNGWFLFFRIPFLS